MDKRTLLASVVGVAAIFDLALGQAGSCGQPTATRNVSSDLAARHDN
jgi:hypothetical protein